MSVTRLMLIPLIAVLAACASSGASPDQRRSDRLALLEEFAGAPVSRFDFWDMKRFEVLGEYEVAVWTTINDAWLIRVRKPCTGLEFAQGLGLTSTNRTVYRNFDAVVFGDQRCRIAEIRPVDGAALKRARRNG